MSTEKAKPALSQAIEQSLSFLRDLGFQFEGVTEAFSVALGTSLTGTYTNAQVNRIVRVVYLPKGTGPREVAITSITLVVPEPFDEFDYTSTGSMEVCVTDLSDIKGDFTTRLAQHLRASEIAFRNQFMAVLTGQHWQSDQLDWGDMK